MSDEEQDEQEGQEGQEKEDGYPTLQGFETPKNDAEADALRAFIKLLDQDLVEVLEEGKNGEITGFRLHLLIPILADPSKPKGATISRLRFGMLTIGMLMESEGKKGSGAQQLKLISDLTGKRENVLRQLNPKDFDNAGTVAYLPFFGPPFLPTGRSS